MDQVLLFLSGLAIGIIAVLFGGSMFLSIPIFQFMFPGMSYGQVVGNLKLGSLFRGLASSKSTWKYIDLKGTLGILIPFVVSSIISTALISRVDQSYLFYAVIAAIFLTELSPRVAHLITKKTRFLFSILIGLYAGFIGAGISLLLLALLRTLYPEKEKILHVKIQALLIETVSTFFIVLAHIWYGNILFPIWIIWCSGTTIGGYLGGHFLKRSVHISPKIQQGYLWIIYLVALAPFIYRAFFSTA